MFAPEAAGSMIGMRAMSMRMMIAWPMRGMLAKQFCKADAITLKDYGTLKEHGALRIRHAQGAVSAQADVERVAGRVEQHAPAVRRRLLGRLGRAEGQRLLLGLVQVVDVEVEVVALRRGLLGQPGAE